MLKIKNLDLLPQYLSKTHGSGLSHPQGVNCYSAIRMSDGQKHIFSISKQARITSWSIAGPDSINVEFLLRSPTTKIKSCYNQFHLSQLRTINVYDSYSEFLTTNRIDFLYVLQSGPSFSLLSSLDLLPVQVPLAQWTYEDNALEDSIDNLGHIVIREKESPDIDLDFS